MHSPVTLKSYLFISIVRDKIVPLNVKVDVKNYHLSEDVPNYCDIFLFYIHLLSTEISQIYIFSRNFLNI